MTPENTIILPMPFIPMLADPAVTGGVPALLLSGGSFLVLDGGAEETRLWLRLAQACLEVAHDAAESADAGRPDWRWHGAVPALAALVQAVLDANDSDDLSMAAPALGMIAKALGQDLYRPTG
jgi:hypothetical protein